MRNAANIRMIPTAPVFAMAIQNIVNGASVSSLFNDDTLATIYEVAYPAA